MKTRDKIGFKDSDELWISIPYDVKKLLSDSENRQVLSLFQKGLLLSKLTAGLTFFFHVVCKFLLCSVRQREKNQQTLMNGRSDKLTLQFYELKPVD